MKIFSSACRPRWILAACGFCLPFFFMPIIVHASLYNNIRIQIEAETVDKRVEPEVAEYIAAFFYEKWQTNAKDVEAVSKGQRDVLCNNPNRQGEACIALFNGIQELLTEESRVRKLGRDLAGLVSGTELSTSEIYGDPIEHPQTENYWGNVNPIGMRACYDEGKRCAETLFFDYYRQHHLNIRVARIFNTYGPRMLPNDGRVVSNFIVQALQNNDITIYGNGSQTRSFCYVDDLIEGVIRFMNYEENFPGPLNLGNPVEFTILELANIVKKLTHSQSNIILKPLPQDDPVRRQPDISLAIEKLHWQPTIALQEGLMKAIDYFHKEQ